MELSEIDLDLMGVNSVASPREEEEFLFEANYIQRVRQIVNRMLDQLSQIAENDRKTTEGLKQKYRVASNEASGLQRRIGDAAPWFAGVTVMMTLSQFMWQHPDDRGLVNSASQVIGPSTKALYDGRLQSQQMNHQSAAALYNTEITGRMQKTGSDSATKQEVLALYNNTVEAQKKASAAGG